MKEKKSMAYTKEFIAERISTDQRWLERAILALYARQTLDEKRVEDALVHNHIGFSAAHAKRLSYAAKWIQSGHHLDGTYLEKARSFCLHYVKQLADIANQEK